MTATPRIYGDLVKEQKNNGEVVLYSMDDEQIYGPTFHTITFSQQSHWEVWSITRYRSFR